MNSLGGVEATFESFLDQYTRPTCLLRPEEDDLTAMVVDVDQRIEENLEKNPAVGECTSLVKIFALTPEGSAVLISVQGFRPYFQASNMNVDLNQLKDSINGRLHKGKGHENCVTRINTELREPIMKYKGEGDQRRHMLQIFLNSPKALTVAKNVIEEGLVLPGGTRAQGDCYESNLPYVLRFMTDLKISGCGWIRIPKGKYSCLRSLPESTCQLEAMVHQSDIQNVEEDKIVPLRILSFDIECMPAADGSFPQATIDPVLTIACVLAEHHDMNNPICKLVLQVRQTAKLHEGHLFCFEEEKEMLKAFAKILNKMDPDILTGQNIIGFDTTQLLTRAKTLNIFKEFSHISRFLNHEVDDRKFMTYNQVMGSHESHDINMPGRITMDAMECIRRDHKLGSYGLNAVSMHFLGEQKDDVKQTDIPILFEKGPKERRILAKYCLKDAVLPIRLLGKLMVVQNSVEMARVTGVPMQQLFSRGQSIKVLAQILRYSTQEGFVIPSKKDALGDQTFEGATVIDPKKGFQRKPIATLDFASLQPSIMIAHNLCQTTLIDHDMAQKLKPEEYTVTTENVVFVKSSKREGLLPRILKNILEARKKAKADLKKATDPFLKAVLDGRQLALKVSANSVQGFTGALNAQLPCLEISKSVTGFGRAMINKTKHLVESHFTVSNGYEQNAVVIQGDTDSVMVNFGVDDLARSMELGKIGAAQVSTQFIDPIKLEFEKVQYPQLLINKKRQAGLQWTKTESQDKLDTKGLELVRRDNCDLVKNALDISLKKLLIEQDVDGAVDQVKSLVSDLLQNKTDISMLIISKTLSKPEEYKSKQPHVTLMEKMLARDKGTAPKVGDRVPQVIIKGNKGARLWEKAEDPIYAVQNGCALDTEQQLENQMKEPILRIFEPVVGAVASQEMFLGSHTKNLVMAVTASDTQKGIGKFFGKSQQCLRCKTKMTNPNAICNSCLDRGCSTFMERELDKASAQREYSQLWTHCMTCQDSLQRAVLCNSKDCPIFYRRAKAKIDLQEKTNTMNRFKHTLDWQNDWW